MQLEMSETYVRPYHVPFYNLRWSAVFAGLAVGISSNLFLVLLGGAAGLAVFNAGAGGDQSLLIAASTWDTLSMVAAAFIGGYVAARASGMRRSADGVMHGVVAWAITVLISALLATSAAGATLSGMFATNRPLGADTARSASNSPRQALLDVLESRFGLSDEEAGRIVDQAMVLSGQEENVSPEARAEARQTARAAALAGSWLSAAVLLSLAAAMGGGVLGARGTRRAVGGEPPHRAPPQSPSSADVEVTG